jgi:hypothetical protein
MSGGKRKPAKADRIAGAGRGRWVLMSAVSLFERGHSERNSASSHRWTGARQGRRCSRYRCIDPPTRTIRIPAPHHNPGAVSSGDSARRSAAAAARCAVNVSHRCHQECRTGPALGQRELWRTSLSAPAGRDTGSSGGGGRVGRGRAHRNWGGCAAPTSTVSWCLRSLARPRSVFDSSVDSGDSDDEPDTPCSRWPSIAASWSAFCRRMYSSFASGVGNIPPASSPKYQLWKSSRNRRRSCLVGSSVDRHSRGTQPEMWNSCRTNAASTSSVRRSAGGVLGAWSGPSRSRAAEARYRLATGD